VDTSPPPFQEAGKIQERVVTKGCELEVNKEHRRTEYTVPHTTQARSSLQWGQMLASWEARNRVAVRISLMSRMKISQKHMPKNTFTEK
jgi:hypothetical protein